MHIKRLKQTICSLLTVSVMSACIILDPATVYADEITTENRTETVTTQTAEDISATMDESAYEPSTDESVTIPSESDESVSNEQDAGLADDQTEEITESVTDETTVSGAEPDVESAPAESSELTDETTSYEDQDSESAFPSSDEIDAEDSESYEIISTVYPDELTSVTIPDDLYNAANTDLYFTEKETILYNILKAQCSEVANGTRTSTQFVFPTSTFGMPTDEYLTASDLGVDRLYDSNYDLTDNALTAIVHHISGDLMYVYFKLIYDCPYELYWHDSLSDDSIFWGIDQYEVSHINGEPVVHVTGNLCIDMRVCECYQGRDEFTISSDAIARAAAAKTNAQAIVAKYASLSDEEKLYAYCQEICDLTEYNVPAADNGDILPYGDPWQLLYVFDNDPATEVVCEGYAKAFKYLCDLSTFKSNVNCILVGGFCTTSGISGAHMWNIVNVNGNNYMVDVTNCDIPIATKNNMPFLKNPASGGTTNGYHFNVVDIDALYEYDLYTRSIYTSAQLTLSNHGWTKDTSGRWWYRNLDGSYPKSAWMSIDGTWYYFNSFGYMTTGWQKIGSYWYYFNNSGAMQKGWIKSNNTWYYLDGLGRMQTGWKAIGGFWYYFDAQGKMQTGWVKVGAYWYYLDASGHMKIGWQAIGGFWYYFDNQGHMQTGWRNINSKWYYFDGNGHMLRNTYVQGFRLGADGAMI